MGQVHLFDILCTLGITPLEGQPTNLAAWCVLKPVAANHSDEILFTRFRYNVLKNHVMNYTLLDPSAAAVLHWSYHLPPYQMTEVCLSNILHAHPILLTNKAFSYPSSY